MSHSDESAHVIFLNQLSQAWRDIVEKVFRNGKIYLEHQSNGRQTPNNGVRAELKQLREVFISDIL